MTEHAIAEQDVRAAINRWGESGFFRKKHLWDQIAINAITELATHVIRLQTLYEERSVSQRKVSYSDGILDDSGMAPDPQDLNVPQPGDFEDHKVDTVIPHTEAVEKCGVCHGAGKVTCSHCGGAGSTACPWCGGMGFKWQMQQRSAFEGGKTVYRMQNVQVRCTCSGGRVHCAKCVGGKQTCGFCAGTGKLKRSDVLHVHFRPARAVAVLNTTAVPDDLILKSTGRTICRESAVALKTVNGVPEVALPRVRSILDEASQDAAAIVRQQLDIDMVQVFHVAFTAPKLVSGRLWICGLERAVYAPEVPAANSRIGWVVAISVGLLLLLAALAGGLKR